MEIKAFITNLGKYNEGELIGKWITLPIDAEELEEVLEKIGINEEYEEYFFTDYDCNFGHNFSEYENIEALNEYAENLEGWDEDAFSAACEVFGFNHVINEDPDNYTLYSDIQTDYDLGYYWIEDSGCYDLSNLGNLANYFDYESFGRDVRFEADGGFSVYGWIEYRG